MQNYLLPESEPWLELAVVLAVGTVVIVGLAALAERFVRSAIWKRTIWQVTTLGLLVLMLVELTGTAPALVRVWRAEIAAAAARPGPVLPTTEEQVSAARPFAKRDWTPPAATDLAWPDDLNSGSFCCGKEGGRGSRRAGIAGTPGDQGSAGASPPQELPHKHFPQQQLGRGDGVNTTFPEATGEEAGENQTWDLGQRAFSSDEEPVSRYADVPEEAAAAALLANAESHTTAADQPLPPPAFWWLGVIWAFGAVVITAWTVCVRTLLFALWRRRTLPGDQALGERVARLARRLGIRRRVRVLEAAGLSAPVAFGSFRPTVAVPVTFADDFDRQQQGAVLAHELAHLAARDPVWQVVAGLVCAALWWHPLAWWLRHQFRTASEAAADEASLLVPDGPHLLAACLVAMGRRLATPQRLGCLSVEGPGFRSSLGRRVERLLNLRTRSWRAPGRGRLLVAKTTLPVALVILAVCCTAWARPQATPREGGTTMSVLTSSWRRSLGATVLLAFFATASGDAVADDPPLDESLPAAAAADLADAHGQLALLAEDEEGEAREVEEREHREIEEREGERREVEEREHREVEEREGVHREAEERERHELHERERGESETERARLTDQLRQLEEKAQDLKHELEGLRDGQDEEARELQGALREVNGRMDAIRRELRGPRGDRERRGLDERERGELEAHLRELREQHRELEERAEAIQRQLQQLGDRNPDKAEQLRGELLEIREKAQHLEREAHERTRAPHGRPGPPPPHEREQLKKRLEDLKHEIGRLEEAGRHEEADRLQRRAHEILRRLEERPEHPREPRPPGPPEVLKRRIHHVRVAIENLHAAGLHDQADGLLQELRRLSEGATLTVGPPEPPPPPGAPRPPEPRERPPHPDLGQRLEQQEQAIHELRATVEQLHREMGQLRKMLEEIAGREREGDR